MINDKYHDNTNYDKHNIKKYPKSKNNFQCLGPCYYPGTMVIHPTEIDIVSDTMYPFCPVDRWDSVDPVTKQTKNMVTDICFNPTEKESINKNELELNILTPYIDFNSEQFLRIYYNIFTFEDSIDWINRNKHVCVTTKARVINSSLKSFGESIDILDNRFSDIFIDYVKAKKIKHIYFNIYNYISVDKKTKEIFLSQNDIPYDDLCTERINYVIKTFLNKDDITKFLIKHLKYRKTVWRNINNHLENMCVELGDYILNKIKMTLKLE